MQAYIRLGLVVIGVLTSLVAACFFLQQSWALDLWPWPLSRLSAIFVASMVGGAAASVLWVALSGELRALSGGALNYAVMYVGMALYCASLADAESSEAAVFVAAVFCTLMAMLCTIVFFSARRHEFKDSRETPVGARVALVLFALIAGAVGLAMVTNRPAIFPWPLKPELSVMFGWIFVGGTCYFIYGLTHRNWANARGQFVGFLVYDLILLVPFLQHFNTVKPELHLNLVVYFSVIVGSGLIALYYLILHPAYRMNARPALRTAETSYA